MAYSSPVIAKAFLELGERDNIPIDPLKLIKLVYFAHGFYLAAAEEPLLNEPVEAWKYGPVISSLYHRFKRYGRAAIPREEIGSIFGPKLDSNAQAAVEAAWETFKGDPAITLSLKTHTPDSPWAKIWRDDGVFSKEIPDHLIADFFKS
jgi:uncharacterized phage-associated protein